MTSHGRVIGLPSHTGIPNLIFGQEVSVGIPRDRMQKSGCDCLGVCLAVLHSPAAFKAASARMEQVLQAVVGQCRKGSATPWWRPAA